jgi:hypothetical protein
MAYLPGSTLPSAGHPGPFGFPFAARAERSRRHATRSPERGKCHDS